MFHSSTKRDELAHIHLHLGKYDDDCFIDDFYDLIEGDYREKEADDLARDAILPENRWQKVRDGLSNKNIFERADEQRLHPAILAGRVRWEQNNYKLFAKSVPNKLSREQLFQQSLLSG